MESTRQELYDGPVWLVSGAAYAADTAEAAVELARAQDALEGVEGTDYSDVELADEELVSLAAEVGLIACISVEDGDIVFTNVAG